ncbi:unnamed protein product [Sympodiomycopsis kandeliae]
MPSALRYGGLEVGRYARPQELEMVRVKVDAIQQQQQQQQPQQERPPLPSLLPLRPDLWHQAMSELQSVRAELIAMHLPPGTTMSEDALRSMASHAVAGLWGLAYRSVLTIHVERNITVGDLTGKTTFWGALSGSGPTIYRKSIDWANARQDSNGTRDTEEIAKRYGGFVNLWPCSRKHWKAHLSVLARRLKRFLSSQANAAASVGAHTLLVLISRQVAAIVSGFETSRFVEKYQGQKGVFQDKKFRRPGLQDAGVVGVVSLSADTQGSRREVISICLPDPGVIKYDPAFRSDWLELIDLLNLKVRLAQTILQAASLETSPVALMQAIESTCRSIGLQGLIDDLRERLTHDQHQVFSERAKSPRSKRQRNNTAPGMAAIQQDRARPNRLLAGPQVIEQALGAFNQRLDHTGRQVDSSEDRDLWEYRVMEELKEMRLVPKGCTTLGGWQTWVHGLRPDQDLSYTAMGSYRNIRTGYSPKRTATSTSTATATATVNTNTNTKTNANTNISPSTTSSPYWLRSLPPAQHYTVPKHPRGIPVPTNPPR